MSMTTIKLFTIICFLNYFLSCGIQNSNNTNLNSNENQGVITDAQELGLRGSIKVLKQEEYISGNSESEIGYKTGKNSFSYKFNQTGSKIEEQFYDSMGVIKEISEYVLSENGQKNKKTIKDLDNNIIQSTSYEYDEFGRIIKINVTINEDGEEYKFYSTSKYDENGNEIFSGKYTLTGEKVQSAEYVYVDNKKVKLTLYDNMESPYAICEYKYNDKGDVNRELYYSGNNILFSEYSIKYLYDTKNNWIQKTYILAKKHIKSAGNAKEKEGPQTITMRTITYF